MSTRQLTTDVLVLGSGPGGYSAAFRAADLGKQVILVDRYDTLGGVCLNVGCIPSKALLHVAKVIGESQYLANHGVKFAEPAIDKDELVKWKNSVVRKLTGGLALLAKQRKVTVLTGVGEFIDENQLQVRGKDNAITEVKFNNAVIAAGSQAIKLPFVPEDPRAFTSTGALELANIKGKLLVIGGGIIGLEMATVYHALGAQVTVVELMNQLIPGADPDLIKPLTQRVSKCYQNILLETKVVEVSAKKDGLYVKFEGKRSPAQAQKFDQILVSVGRRPNGHSIGAKKIGLAVDDAGFIKVDKQMRTNLAHIFAIGDIVGQPMLAHKAIHEAKVAAEVIAGKKHYFDPKGIASVAYTDPEVAWVGVTEQEAIDKGLPYGTGVFPWAANGRSLSLGRDEGITKVLFDTKTNQIIGAGIVGPNAGELIAEAALAIEMGCDAEDIELTIHPHPTLTETFAAATEMFTGTITDLLPYKKK